MELELSAGVLDRQIDNLKAEIADEYFDDEKLELLIEYAMKLGEVYAQRDLLEKAKAQAVPEGYVLLPRVPTEKMFQAYERSSVAPMSTLSKTGYKAMVEAAGDQNENS
ncbi:hypothetical protein JUNP543_3251 [Acinetobacter baumannii]|uniref:hypothetical protein n=2 Tax=Acinetobacter calcoaceticus/baumannii complex TaxID=909768 RepID=UPI0006AC8455|nr:hypothetical protein [Acinetobacter baumannii]KAA8936527.1 hypothetical protein DLI75_02330 [Acinetobacter baumannii]KAA8942814.1 hypothetical protein DLI74_06555 [Acinetobacter baumannii]KOP90816.1 hypothetical protein AKG96_05125 [Acinetobacter baumannii]MCA4339064.1 hypothetical protein [Acinetobacter baumannii]MCA4441070.1 hypothetical protein [Acinetobacter baumannii]